MRKGKAVAKDNMTFPEYEPRMLWFKGQTYEAIERDGMMIVANEYGGNHYFAGVARDSLGQCFEFRFPEETEVYGNDCPTGRCE